LTNQTKSDIIPFVDSRHDLQHGRMAQLVVPTGTFSRRTSYELLKCPPRW